MFILTNYLFKNFKFFLLTVTYIFFYQSFMPLTIQDVNFNDSLSKIICFFTATQNVLYFMKLKQTYLTVSMLSSFFSAYNKNKQ